MSTIMEKEALEAPQRIREQLDHNAERIAALGETLRQFKPRFVMMIGRGSSDHAGVFGRYLMEVELGVPGFAAAPSIASVYGRQLNLEGGLVIVISQSGRSPDILAQAQMAKAAGAYCVALVNDESSPLAEIVDCFVPLKAGAEKAVAATKSYLATLSALLQITAEWSQSQSLAEAVAQLPTTLERAIAAPTRLTAESLGEVENLMVLSRGLGYGIGREIALKLKEVGSLHAESFSSAEFLHGPVTLAEKALTVVDVAVRDESARSHSELMDNVAQRGARVINLDPGLEKVHPRLAPLAILQRFYLDVAQVALARGVNPDEPAGLNKVTRTL